MEMVSIIKKIDSTPLCMDNIEIYDVVIIGGGLSGLSAAYRLFKERPSLKIKILEAKDRIGGRLLSIELPAKDNTTDIWDVGGTWIGDKVIQPCINRLLEDLDIHTYPQNFRGKKLLQTGKNFNVTEYDFLIPDIGIVSLIDTSTLIKHLHNIEKKISTSDSCYDKTLTNLDSSTAENFVQSKIWTKCTLDCTRAAIRATFGSELCKLSALYLIAFGKSCGGLFNVIESSETSSHGYKIVGGAQRICSRILEIIGSEKVQLDTVVTGIEKLFDDNDEPYSLVRTSSGVMVQAKHIVLATPPNLTQNIQFQPPLSPTKYEFFSSVSPGHIIKSIITYEKAFWINDGFSGEIVSNGGKSSCDDCATGPLCVVFDATTYNKSPALLCLICGQQALEYETKTSSERKEAVLASLEMLFKNKLIREYIVYSEKIWRHEAFVGGCPLSIVPPGVGKHLNSNLRAPENGIYFAVSELSETWMGLMEGAVQNGENAATQILSKY